VQSVESQLMFLRNMLHPSSGWKNKPSKKPANFFSIKYTQVLYNKMKLTNLNSLALVRKRTIPTEWPPLVSETAYVNMMFHQLIICINEFFAKIAMISNCRNHCHILKETRQALFFFIYLIVVNLRNQSIINKLVNNVKNATNKTEDIHKQSTLLSRIRPNCSAAN
jgi:hypothetical protein